MAHVVNLELVFADRFFIFVSTNQVMQNLTLKLRQTSIISTKPRFMSEKLEILTSFNYHTVWYFLLKFCTRFLLSNVCKMVCEILLVCLDLEFLIKV